MVARVLCWMPYSMCLSSNSTSRLACQVLHMCTQCPHMLSFLPSGLTCARLGRAALILPGVTGAKELGSHHHCVRGRHSLNLAVQLVTLIGADIRAVYPSEVLCVAAHHLQQWLWTMTDSHVRIHAGIVWLMGQCQ